VLWTITLLFCVLVIYLVASSAIAADGSVNSQWLLDVQTFAEVSASNTNFTTRDVSRMRTPFPSPQELAEFDSIAGVPPFDVDVVFNYGGYRDRDHAGAHARDQGELQYSLRSVFLNMPWIRHIFIVCPDELAEQLSASSLWPPWLDADSLSFETPSNGRQHSIIFVAQSRLFVDSANAIGNRNSNAFEINLHRTPGLSEHFISFCDDFFAGRPVPWTFFFAADPVADTKWIPRISWSIFKQYFAAPAWSVRRYATTYDCDVLQLKSASVVRANFTATSDIPARVTQYYSHAPRPLTKSLMREFVAKYPKWFRFVESHKERWCCPLVYFWQKRNYACWRQENLWLTLYKQYVDFELRVDIMDDTAMLDIDHDRIALLPYHVSAKDFANYYHEYKGWTADDKFSRLLDIRPYTFAFNDHFAQEPCEYLRQFRAWHIFANTYWPRQAPFEKQSESVREMTWWYATAVQLSSEI